MNFLVFYFAQLYALVEALGQVLLLIVVALYRWRFLDVTTRQKAVPTEAGAGIEAWDRGPG
ncbi:MAG: hypothetical protein IPK16_17980 [Anaerolineales bacterium]|nr:hypothetical protein [Anaerolineales bacterium]